MARTKAIMYGVLGIIIGGILFFGGISTLSNPGTVTCGGETMSQGDTCVQINGDSSTVSNDYNQQQQSNNTTGIFLFIFGPLILVGSLFLLRSGMQHNSARSSSPSDMRFQMNRPSQSGAYSSSSHSPQQPEGRYRE